MIKVGEKKYGFTVNKITESRECGGNLVYLTHDKVGTELLWVDNKASNKLFSITFKTLPENSTGVFHILEHSVLCGSDKFPVKEPFVDLLKSSMNTFLNAMTFQDKTMYPVSSRNDLDFLNLTSVYLDAVFAPAILKNKYIFCQEGWHIEEDEDGTLSYKGVVFNEMKGVMSGKEGLISESLLPVLFPDNCYGVNSGGDPEHIPDLTYEEFINTYKRFYHPSNSRIYLDGDVPLDKTLELIDSYLCRFEKSDNLPVFVPQVPKSCNKTIEYAIGEEEDTKDKAQLTIAKIIGSWDDPIRTQAAGVIFNALSDSNESPFKKAVLDSGLAQDLEIYVNDEMAQIYLTIDAKNIKDGCEDELLKLIRKVAREQVENGIDKKAIIAAINYAEFKIKAPDEPAALTRNIKAMLSWLYGGDPYMYLESEYMFKALREMIKTDEYEKLLSDILLNDEGLCILKSVPSKTLAAEKDAKEAEKLSAIKSQRSKKAAEENRKLNEELLAWQQTEDSPEDTAKLPVLPISELGEDFEFDTTELSYVNGVKLLYHPIKTSGVVYLSAYFKLTDKSLEDLTKLSQLASILSYVGTKKHDALSLEQEIKTWLGSLSFNIGVFSDNKEYKAATPVLIGSCSVLEENVEHAKELMYEVLSSTVFDKEDIYNILLQADMRGRQSGIVMGHSMGKLAVMSRYSADDAVNEAIGGYTLIKWLHEICENYETKADELINLYETTVKNACVKSRMTVSISCDEKIDVSDFINLFDEGTKAPEITEYKSNVPFNLGSKIPALVGFAVQGCNLNAIGKEYKGALTVACNILTLDYFWNQVRVQGGAYGTGIKAGLGGSLCTYSYRDPNLKRSIDVNKGAAEHLRKFCENKEEIDKYIISSVSGTEPLVGPQQRAAMADRDYFCGYTYEMLKNRRMQMIKTDYDSLMQCADIIDQFAENGALCITGPAEKLAEFDNLEVREF